VQAEEDVVDCAGGRAADLPSRQQGWLSVAAAMRSYATIPLQIWRYARLRRVTWIEEGRIAACAYPRREGALRGLAAEGVSLLVNLHERAHPPEALSQHGLAELHLPVSDFTAPSQEQLARGVAAIEDALAGGQRVAVHCGAGLGRTGTLVASYLTRQGYRADDAIARVRGLRPGSVETAEQVAAVAEFGRRQARERQDAPS
jgi:atypical dual specificity phosphatase